VLCTQVVLGYNMILPMVHATSCMQIIGIWSYKLGVKVLGAAIHSISHASVSDRPNTAYLLFATLSYAKSLRNLIVATESVWMNGIHLCCKLIHFLTKKMRCAQIKPSRERIELTEGQTWGRWRATVRAGWGTPLSSALLQTWCRICKTPSNKITPLHTSIRKQ